MGGFFFANTQKKKMNNTTSAPARHRRSSIRYYQITDEFSHRMQQVIACLDRHNLHFEDFEKKIGIPRHKFYLAIRAGSWGTETSETIWDDILQGLKMIEPSFQWNEPFKEWNPLEEKIDFLTELVCELISAIKNKAVESKPVEDRLAEVRMLRMEAPNGKPTITPVRVVVLTQGKFDLEDTEKVKDKLTEKYPESSWQVYSKSTLLEIDWETAEVINLVL